MLYVPAGGFETKLVIETPTVTNTDGASTTTWAATGRTGAKVVPRQAVAEWRAAQMQPETTHLVHIPFRRTGIDSKSRLVNGSRILHIVGPPKRIPEARPRYLEMECVEAE